MHDNIVCVCVCVCVCVTRAGGEFSLTIGRQPKGPYGDAVLYIVVNENLGLPPAMPLGWVREDSFVMVPHLGPCLLHRCCWTTIPCSMRASNLIDLNPPIVLVVYYHRTTMLQWSFNALADDAACVVCMGYGERRCQCHRRSVLGFKAGTTGRCASRVLAMGTTGLLS